MKVYEFDLGYNEAKKVSIDWNMGWNESLFQYDYHRLYLITEGHGKILFRDMTSMDILPGYLYFIPVYSLRQTTTLEDMYQYYIHFKFESLMVNTQLEFSPPQAVPLSANEITYYIQLFQTVFDNSSQQNFLSSLRTTSAFMSLLSKSIENISFENHDILIFKDTVAYISNNLSQQLSIEQLADSMGYNPCYFSEKFKKVFGIPPQQFISKRRLNHSLKLLKETDDPIEQIAFSCGFNSVAYFIKQFKLNFQTTPLQYRIFYRGIHGKK